MNAIGFVGGSHAPDNLSAQLRAEGAQMIINDMRALKSAENELRGW